MDIVQGHLKLEECDISSQGLACVGIHGGADPVLRRNRIHDGREAGVVIYEAAEEHWKITRSSPTPPPG